MLPSMQGTATTTVNNNNSCLMETEQDVAHVEYDVINYYTDANPNPNPDTIPTSALPQQRCSRVNNNSNTLLDVVVHSRPARDNQRTVGQQGDPTVTPTATTSDGSNGTSPMRSKGGGNSSSRQRSKGSTAAATPTLGVNMRVTGQCSQGGRKYMEDQFSVAYQESPLTHELEYAFFGIYDGHGGTEAALFAKEHLMLEIVKQKLFWSDKDEDVLRAIREGYIGTHFAMWREQEKWPRTANGHLSTAGTTATVAFMRREKIYIGHVGDSGIVLGYQNPNERRWRAKQLTTDHKPESMAEKTRIQRAGGQVAIKSGVPRVVWNRPRDPMHRGPIRRRTLVDDIPFLAVARSLGDLWSYNSRCKEFVVSPDPDVKVVKIDPNTFRCLIFGTDGLWNVVTPQEAVDTVRERHLLGECLREQDVMNPSKALVDKALKTWATKKMRADNTSVVTVILSPASEAGITPSSVPAAAAAAATATEAPTTAAGVAAALSNNCTDIEMLELVEPLDTENKYPAELGEELEHEDFDVDELCNIIEEKEYVHDTPYSALAKRHLPPEPYRNFDYYIEEEYETEVEGEEEQEDEEATAVLMLQQQQHSKYWRKSLNQSIAASWQQQHQQHHHHQTPTMQRQRQRENESETDADTEPVLEMYASSEINSCHTSSELSGLEQDLVHEFNAYGAAVSATTEFSFAESYNSLLNEQQEQQQQQQQQQSEQLQHEQHQQQQLEDEQQQHQLMNSSRSMMDILQEQQHYQQQEGYSLTQLETRREQQQQQQQQQQQHHHEQEHQQHHEQEQQDNSNRWQTATTYVEQPTELLALNELLQQERDEEQQVALERQQQQQQLLLVESSSSCSSSTSLGQTEFVYDATATWSENVATLQDNEVSSTLPATPTPTTEVEMEVEVEKMETCTSKPEPQQWQPQQQAQQQQQATQQQAPQQQQQQQLQTEPKLKRQMRRYRNVPNENHQHMQTRRRQLFKHGKPKSYISTSAAAIVAYGNSNNHNNSSSGGTNSNDTLPSSSINNNTTVNSNNNNSNAGNGSNSRRRSVANSAGGSGSVMVTRRSHSLSLATGGSVSKRQLRSSICQLSQLGSLDLTKRTLRTRNVTPAQVNNNGSNSVGSNNKNTGSTSNNNNSSTGSSSSNNNNNNKSNHTFNKPATPTAATTSVQVGSARRLRRSNDEREQRRSLRRSTLIASQLGGSSSGNTGSVAGQFSKPTRLQSCSGAIAARPPPSPKKLNAVVPTLAIGTRAYTAALAAAADLGKRWSLRSSNNSNNNSSSNSNSNNNINHGNNNNAMATLVTAISCYSARGRTSAASATTSRRR